MNTMRTVDEVVAMAGDLDGNMYAAMRSGRVWKLDASGRYWGDVPPLPGTEAQRADLAARSEATDG